MDDTLRIFKFKDYETIVSTPRFVEGHPFDEDSYKNIVGVYRLKEKLNCCFLRGGRVCNTPHNYGYVVELNDGCVTLVGNECVNKLSSEEKLFVDVKAFKKEESRQEKLEIVKERLAGEVCTIDEVADAYARIKKLESFVTGFLHNFPRYASRTLEHHIKSSSGGLGVTLVYFNRYKDEEGNEKVEKNRVRTKVYNIQGIRFLNPRLIASTRKKVVDAKGFCLAYEEIKQSTPMRRLMEISKGLSSFQRVMKQIEEFEGYYKEFMRNDFRFFCFLSPVSEERIKIAELAISMDAGLSNYKPSEIYKDVSAEVLRASGAEKIEV